MHALSAMVGVFGASVWDLAENHGEMARFVAHFVSAGLRAVGIL